MQHRVFVSTVASIAGKSSLLELKKFNTAIIDEASQILEPMLVGMLPHFERFVLIGDHKQLPAVVLQDKERSAVKDEALHEIGLFNRRNSLFERLYNQAQQNGWTWAYDMLSHQGRMHADICSFPSHFFYDGLLKLLPEELPISAWQKEPLAYILPTSFNPMQELLANNRMLFFSCEANRFKNQKTNINEAQMVGQIISNFHAIYTASGKTWDPKNIGVITPFRAQIAQIRHVLSDYEQGFEECTIDTVERYQGGARDIIIISLCLNNPFQLDSIISLSDDQKVDRKLNVALTRARQHLVVVGNESLMQEDKRYSDLMKWIDDNLVGKNNL
jgi:DNA replication ATP-dependent helicase Dna2